MSSFFKAQFKPALAGTIALTALTLLFPRIFAKPDSNSAFDLAVSGITSEKLANILQNLPPEQAIYLLHRIDQILKAGGTQAYEIANEENTPGWWKDMCKIVTSADNNIEDVTCKEVDNASSRSDTQLIHLNRLEDTQLEDLEIYTATFVRQSDIKVTTTIRDVVTGELVNIATDKFSISIKLTLPRDNSIFGWNIDYTISLHGRNLDNGNKFLITLSYFDYMEQQGVNGYGKTETDPETGELVYRFAIDKNRATHLMQKMLKYITLSEVESDLFAPILEAMEITSLTTES